LIVLDTNIFYNFLFETNLTEKSERILETYEPLFSTFTVWNETIYVVSRKLAEIKFGIKSYVKFRKLVAEEGYSFCAKEIEAFESVIRDLNITVLRDYQNPREISEIMSKFKLLPNDALIAATCRHYGIRKIATFDEDFRRVDFLEVVEP